MSTTAPAPAKKMLTFVDADAVTSKLNTLLYGPPGVGKSTGACSGPGPVLHLNAEAPSRLAYAFRHHGAGHINMSLVRGRQSLTDAALYLKDGGKGERTVVLDPVEGIWRILIEEMAPHGRPTLQQFGDAGTLIERFCRFLCNDCPQNIVLVCHEQSEETDDGVRLIPSTGGRKNPQILSALADVVGYCGTMREKDGALRYVAQVEPSEKRYAKNSNGVLERIVDVNISEWLRLHAEAAKPSAKEKKA